MYVAAWIGTSSVDKSFKKKNSKNADFEKCKFSNQRSKSNQTKEDVSVSNWMTEAQRKEFEALAKNK